MDSAGRAAVGPDERKKWGGRIGLLGGTFDPVHNGHLRLAEQVLQTLKLDSILFVPAARPPHKGHGAVASFEHRLAMVKIAVRANPKFFVSDIEGARSGPSYSIDTLKQLRGILDPEILPVFIIGMDAFVELNSWKCWQEVLDCTDLAVVPRPDYPLAGIGRVIIGFGSYSLDPRLRCWVASDRKGRIYPVDMTPVAISSTEIRRRIASGLPVVDLVPGEVADYIRTQHQYDDYY